jgi:hypothetical protein
VREQVEVGTRTLENVIDALEGLAAMATFAGAREPADVAPLRDELAALDGFGQLFGSLRYGRQSGQAWLQVAAKVDELRDELLRCYTEAAL